MSVGKFLILFVLVMPTSIISERASLDGLIDEAADGYKENGEFSDRSNSAGLITNMVIGRNGNEVLVRMNSDPAIECSPLHPNGYRYVMFMDTTPGADEILKALFLAQQNRRLILIVGNNKCVGISNDPGFMMEEIQYVILSLN